MRSTSPPPRAPGRRRSSPGLRRRASGVPGGLRAVLAALVTTLAVTAALAPAGAADTGATTGAPPSGFHTLLGGTWTYQDQTTGELSHYRLVLDGAGQGHREHDWAGTWQREVDIGVCHRDQPSYQDVTGNGPVFTVRYRDGCNDTGDGPGYSTGRFVLGIRETALTLAITYDTVSDGVMTDRDHTEYLTRPLRTSGPDGSPTSLEPDPDLGLVCGEGDAAVTVPWPDAFALVENARAWPEVSDEAAPAGVEADPCVLFTGTAGPGTVEVAAGAGT
jgi:hypothetical protein